MNVVIVCDLAEKCADLGRVCRDVELCHGVVVAVTPNPMSKCMSDVLDTVRDSLWWTLVRVAYTNDALRASCMLREAAERDKQRHVVFLVDDREPFRAAVAAFSEAHPSRTATLCPNSAAVLAHLHDVTGR